MKSRIFSPRTTSRRARVARVWAAWAAAAALCGAGGCQSLWEEIKGPGFPGWNGEGMRGKSADAKSSGFFTSRKAEQIEKDLGGDY